VKEDTPICQACREARYAYDQRYRSDPVNKLARSLYGTARIAALRELAKVYPAEFQKLYVEKVRATFAKHELPVPMLVRKADAEDD